MFNVSALLLDDALTNGANIFGATLYSRRAGGDDVIKLMVAHNAAHSVPTNTTDDCLLARMMMMMMIADRSIIGATFYVTVVTWHF